MNEVPLPLGWTWTTLGDLGDWIGGGTPSKSNAAYWSGGTIPWVSPKDMKRSVIDDAEDRITEAAVAESSTQLVPPGTVLLVTRSGILQHTIPVATTARPVALNQDLKALVPHPGVLPEYVAYFVRARQQDVLARCSKAGTTVASIGLEALRAYPVPLPPEAEQRRIVAKLDELLASSRVARAALDAVPALLERYRQAVLAAAFRGDLADEDSVSGAKLLGGWSFATIGELAADVPRAIQSGPFGSSLKHEEFQDTGILAIGIDNVHADGFRIGRNNRINEEKFRELSKYAARPGDVLVTVMATVGRCCVVPDELETAIITKHVYRMSVDRARVLPEYLMYALQGSETVRMQMAAATRGQTRPGINGEILRSLRVPLAPLGAQRRIVAQLRDTLARARALETSIRSHIMESRTLEEALLTQAFRGELVPQDPADEPAAALLARLRAERTPSPNSRTRRAPTTTVSI